MLLLYYTVKAVALINLHFQSQNPGYKWAVIWIGDQNFINNSLTFSDRPLILNIRLESTKQWILAWLFGVECVTKSALRLLKWLLCHHAQKWMPCFHNHLHYTSSFWTLYPSVNLEFFKRKKMYSVINIKKKKKRTPKPKSVPFKD